MLLHFLRWLRDNSDLEPEVLLITGGELLPAFGEVAPVTVIAADPAHESRQVSVLRRASWGDPLAWPPPPSPAPERLVRLAARRALVRGIRGRLEARGSADLIYLNSTFSASALSLLGAPVPLITHAHEMGFTLAGLRDRRPWPVQAMLARTDRYIAASTPVRSALVEVLGIEPSRIAVCHESVPVGEPPCDAVVEQARHELGIPPEALVVGTVGALNWRKGPDLFLHVAKRTIARHRGQDVRFIWMGPAPKADGTEAQIRHDLAAAGLADRVSFIGARADPQPVMALFDVFVLASREDPFPLACLEAAALGKPVVCFDAGGMSEFIEPGERLVVPYLDIEAMTSRIVELLNSSDERRALGAALARRVAERHTVTTTAPRLLALIAETLGSSNRRAR